MIVKKCEECGKKFEVFSSGRKQQYCSNQCYWKSIGAWTNEEVAFLKKKWLKMTISQIAEKLGRSKGSVSAKKFQIDLPSKKREKKITIKKCKECEKRFEAESSRKHQKYCSYECYWKSKRMWDKKILQCKICGRKFKANSPNAVSRKCCSKSCALESRKKSLKGHVSWNKDKIIRNCLVCGGEFEVTRNSPKKYCSHECYTSARLKFRKYGQPDNTFFKKWSNDMAYILGFIYADGCIYKPRRKRESNLLCITIKDKELLEKIRDKIAKRYPLYIHKPTGAWQLRVPSNEMVSDLEKRGITERKTPVKEFPEVPQEYLADFIRGYFDGDGSISIYKTKQDGKCHLGCSIVSGSRKFLEKLNAILKTKGIGINSNVTQPPSVSKGSFILAYGGKTAMKFCEFIYSGRSSLKMKRKYEKFIAYKGIRK